MSGAYKKNKNYLDNYKKFNQIISITLFISQLDFDMKSIWETKYSKQFNKVT